MVLRVRAKMAEERVTGPGDSVVAEMIKLFSQGKIYEITMCFQLQKKDQKLQSNSPHIGDVEVVCNLFVFFCDWKEKKILNNGNSRTWAGLTASVVSIST